MSSFRVNLGINDLQRQLGNIAKYDTETQGKMRDAVRKSTENIMLGAKRRAPVRSGKLIRKINMKYDGVKNEGCVSAKSPYAHLVEFGARSADEEPKSKSALHGGIIGGFAARVKIPKRREHPYLRPAFEAEKPNLVRSITEAVNNK